MKTFSVLALIFVLTATLFTGCRRNNETTGAGPSGTNATTTTPSTTAAPTTKPAETTRPDGTGVVPSMTDIMPDASSGTGASSGNSMGRSQNGPRI